MRGNIYIDEINAWERFGVWVKKGGYNDLLIFPSMAIPDTNDWPEEDGIEVDLESPTIDPLEAEILFVASNPGIDIADFRAYLSRPGYHVFRIPSLNREWKLRLLDSPENNIYGILSDFSLRFSIDQPERYEVQKNADPGLILRSSSYAIDGINLSSYGIFVIEGKRNLMKSPAVKSNLSRTISTKDGRIYDADVLFFQSKEITFKCGFKAISIDNFWNCYDEFFNSLIQPGERTMYVDYTGYEYPCYYKSSSEFEIQQLTGGHVFVTFSLMLIFTSFRINEIEYLLASEYGDYIVLEEDGETMIDLNYYG